MHCDWELGVQGAKEATTRMRHAIACVLYRCLLVLLLRLCVATWPVSELGARGLKKIPGFLPLGVPVSRWSSLQVCRYSMPQRMPQRRSRVLRGVVFRPLPSAALLLLCHICIVLLGAQQWPMAPGFRFHPLVFELVSSLAHPPAIGRTATGSRHRVSHPTRMVVASRGCWVRPWAPFCI